MREVLELRKNPSYNSFNGFQFSSLGGKCYFERIVVGLPFLKWMCINFFLTFRTTPLKHLLSFFVFLKTIDPLIACESEFKG